MTTADPAALPGQRTGSAAFVQVPRDERDPQRFWLSVLSALRQTSAGSVLVRPLTAAPDLREWAITERLLTDLAPLGERLWLVIDDLHELHSDQARRHLELLMLRAPQELRLVLAARHDMRLGLRCLWLDIPIRVGSRRNSLAASGPWRNTS
jgi:LuxR family transcriptional regulator, maltose regulon positive regulatory protein